jgi:hypothetical protein
MASQSATKFAMQLATVFEVPKAGEGFLEAIATACDGFTGEVYERAFRRLRDTRKYRTLPMPAEAKAVCEEQASFVEARKIPVTPKPAKVEEWSPEAAFEFCRRSAAAVEAAKEGWIGPLITFVRRNHRLPERAEFGALKAEHKRFEDAVAITMGGGTARQWRALGEAMMSHSAAWADQVLGNQQREAA